MKASTSSSSSRISRWMVSKSISLWVSAICMKVRSRIFCMFASCDRPRVDGYISDQFQVIFLSLGQKYDQRIGTNLSGFKADRWVELGGGGRTCGSYLERIPKHSWMSYLGWFRIHQPNVGRYAIGRGYLGSICNQYPCWVTTLVAYWSG